MLLLTHIIVALSSVLQATYALVQPTRTKIRVSYGLVATTLGSGALLVWQLRVPLTQPCLSGLLYIVMLTGMLLGARYRLRLTSQGVNTTGWSNYLDK